MAMSTQPNQQPTEPDDLERVAAQDDLQRLTEYLATRRVLIPRRPRRLLDAANFTQDQLLEQIRQDAHDMKHAPFEPWILELDNMKRLPVFSSKERAHAFSRTISRHLSKVFSLACCEVLLWEFTKSLDVDFVDLNLYSEKSWQIEVKRHGA